MLHAIVATACIGLILVLSEVLWRHAHIRGEFARKFVHILAGVFIAFLPFWNSYGWITLLAIGFIIANILNRYSPLFHAIHAITRKSWGDFLFAIGILVSALVRPNKWLFAGAILQVALADGLAAVIGTHYAKHRYKIVDHFKSPIGTLTFYIASVATLYFVVYLGNLSSLYHTPLIYLLVPIGMTILENISGYGSDNVFLPVGFLLLMHVLRV
jgi:phytol kinase